MRIKQSFKKYIWFLPVILTTLWLIGKAQTAAADIRIVRSQDFTYYRIFSWLVFKEIAVILPVWLLSLLGLARAFLGENWFPFAQKIPISVTRIVFVATAILLVGVTVAGSVYTANSTDSLNIRYRMEETFQSWKTLLAWVLYYTGLLYMEQWCFRRNYSRKSIRQRQFWGTITVALTWLICGFISSADMWYIPLNHVDSANRLEDYFLWWYGLYLIAFFIPLWFFSARKVIRLFREDPHWLTLSTILPRKVVAAAALATTGLTVWQIRECCVSYSWIAESELPEHAEAVATGHQFQAMIWGLVLIYALFLLRKQRKLAYRKKREDV